MALSDVDESKCNAPSVVILDTDMWDVFQISASKIPDLLTMPGLEK